jgi:(E)-4-hydroxy-3-methylbut-2-enyl-diphosphate synthase
MTNTKTEDSAATIKQIARLKMAGCDIVRLAVPTIEAARAITEIKYQSELPIVADIHFDYRLALEAIKAGADKIRINPGNIGDKERIRRVALACGEKGIPIRIGINGGSLDKAILNKFGGVTAEAMCHSAAENIALLTELGFEDICISLKASEVMLTIEACRMFSERYDYPLHLGVTEAGGDYSGLVQSAVGIGTLLCEGIGDTIRVSLTADPVDEGRAGIEILKAAGLRQGLRLISCPTCGRCDINLIAMAREAERALEGLTDDITVAVMGCEVNGPGEAKNADYGIAGGRGQGLLFRRGEIVGKFPAEGLVLALVDLIKSDGIK